MNFLKNYKSSFIILFSIFFGIFTGIIMREKAKIFLPIGNIFINMTFTLIIPLVFFSVSSSIVNITNASNTKKTLIVSCGIFLMMSFIVTCYMLFIAKIFPFGDTSKIYIIEKAVEKTESLNILEKIPYIFTTTDFEKMLSKTTILPLILFSGLFGFAVRALKERAETVKKCLNNCSEVAFKMIRILMLFAPIGLFAYFASFFGSANKELFGPLAKVIFVYYFFGISYAIISYIIYAYISAGKHGIQYLKYLLMPTATALATQSSLASLPANFEASKRMNVPNEILSLVLPFGAILHLEGSSLAAVLKLSFLFIIFNVPLTGSDFYFGIFMFSILVSLMTTGIPGGGIVLEVLMITIYGFPMDSLAILILINYLIDPIATAINTDSNVVGTMLITRVLKGKGWNFDTTE